MITPPGTFSTPDTRFDNIHIDIVGPLPPSKGYSYWLTCIDRFTRWPEAFPLTNITAKSISQTFVNGWISRFGIPSTITTDHGKQFESTLWGHLMQLLGCKQICTTAYHPIANGIIERFHRQLKSSLKSYPNPTNWTAILPIILLGIHTTLKDDLQCTAAELVYGTTLRLPGEFFDSSTVEDAVPDPFNYVTRLKAAIRQLKAVPNKTFVDSNFSNCSHAVVHRDSVHKLLQQPYDGPYQILSRADKYFTLDVNGKKAVISLDRLKPAYLDLPSSTSLSDPPQDKELVTDHNTKIVSTGHTTTHSG